MFQKIIENIKYFISQLEEDELTTLGTVFGLIILGFIIYGAWQVRLGTFDRDNYLVVNIDQQEEDQLEIPTEPEEEISDDDEEEIVEPPEPSKIETPAGYQILNITNQINEKNEATLFGVLKPAIFSVEYQGITNAIFENQNNLSLEDWIDYQVSQSVAGPESIEEKKDSLDILMERRRNTPLGQGIEIVRMNGYQSSELLVSFNNYIVSFYYKVESAQQVSARERSREQFFENIQ